MIAKREGGSAPEKKLTDASKVSVCGKKVMSLGPIAPGLCAVPSQISPRLVKAEKISGMFPPKKFRFAVNSSEEEIVEVMLVIDGRTQDDVPNSVS